MDAIAAIVTPIIAAGSALLGAFITGRMQERKSEGDHYRQVRLENEMRRRSLSDKALEELRDARLALCRISREASMTMSCIASVEEMTPQVYNRRYIQLLADLDRIEVAIDCWAPELRGGLNKLRGAYNCFWGEQQHLLHLERRPEGTLPSGDTVARAAQEARVKIATIARDAEAAVFELRNGMHEAHIALLGLFEPPAWS